jgi:pimeloyl-ACP methyl ester carboxylesterase
MLYHTFRSPRSTEISVRTSTRPLPDGQSQFGCSRTTVQPPNPEAPTTRLILLNGLYEGRYAYRGLATSLAREALERGHGFDAVTYDDPRVGSSAYGQSYRAERAATLVRRMTTDSTSQPVTLVGHSRGNWSGVTIAPDLLKEGRIDGLLSIGGIGYTPQEDERELTPAKILRLVGRELASPESRRLARLGAPVLSRLVSEGAVHTLTKFDAALGEVREILSVDNCKETVRLSQDIPVGVIALTRDNFCPGQATRQNLEAAHDQGHIFAGTITEMPTSHAGPLVDRQFVPDMYDMLCSSQESMV